MCMQNIRGSEPPETPLNLGGGKLEPIPCKSKIESIKNTMDILTYHSRTFSTMIMINKLDICVF